MLIANKVLLNVIIVIAFSHILIAEAATDNTVVKLIAAGLTLKDWLLPDGSQPLHVRHGQVRPLALPHRIRGWLAQFHLCSHVLHLICRSITHPHTDTKTTQNKQTPTHISSVSH